MKTFVPRVCAVVALMGQAVCAQEIAGTWQGTIAKYQGFRFIVRVEHGPSALIATFSSIDQSRDPVPVGSIEFQHGVFKFQVPSLYGAYRGTLSADGQSVVGTWTWADGSTLPLELRRATKDTEWKVNLAPHKVQLIPVAKDVKLEVLDWGGTGRAVVLLAGLGRTAHVFDRFGSDLTARYHVYGITRRGFGESSAPVPDGRNYSSDQLGDDVLEVLDVLKLQRPVLIGHSIAGEELSSIGSRRPERVAGLVYLECYAYAFYDRSHGDLLIDSLDVHDQIERLLPGRGPIDERQLIESLLASLPRLEKDLQQRLRQLPVTPAAKVETRRAPPPVLTPADAIQLGVHKYTDIRSACLAIFAEPHEIELSDPTARAQAEARDLEATSAQSKAVEAGFPTCRVVRLPHANHSVYLSNEADVLHEVTAFVDGLP
jgi:pimeloyl-ACP methyl ester carboxylesterase